MDSSFVQTDDEQSAFGLSGDEFSTGIGADYRLSDQSILGVQILWNRAESESLMGTYNLTSEGIALGPYVAISLNDMWALYGSLTWGSFDTDVELLSLSGNYDQEQIAADIILTGQYSFDDGSYIRPQFSLGYKQFDTPDHQLQGAIAATPVSIDIAGGTQNYGTFNPSIEFGQIYKDGRTLWVPYGEIGAVYEFSRPDRSGPFTTEDTSEWSGTIRAGLRVNTEGAFHADLSLGYLSAFQADLDAVEAGLYLAWGF